MKKLVLIESEGLLYRGPAPNHPTEIWHYPRRCWVPFRDSGVMEDGWGKEIALDQAARLKTDNVAAEHFMYYDTPPWSQPLSQAYHDAVQPAHVKKALTEARGRSTKP